VGEERTGKPFHVDILYCKTKEDKGEPLIGVFKSTYCGWQKGMSWDELKSSSKEIKLIPISINEFCLHKFVSCLYKIQKK